MCSSRAMVDKCQISTVIVITFDLVLLTLWTLKLFVWIKTVHHSYIYTQINTYTIGKVNSSSAWNARFCPADTISWSDNFSKLVYWMGHQLKRMNQHFLKIWLEFNLATIDLWLECKICAIDWRCPFDWLNIELILVPNMCWEVEVQSCGSDSEVYQIIDNDL